MNAKKLLPLGGRPVFRFPVKVTFGETAALHQVNHYPAGVVHVISRSAREAADLIYAEVAHRPCTEIEVFGPKGGIAARRWIGWETAIGNQMFSTRPESTQLTLRF